MWNFVKIRSELGCGFSKIEAPENDALGYGLGIERELELLEALEVLGLGIDDDMDSEKQDVWVV